MPKIDFTGVSTSQKVLEEGLYPATFAGATFVEKSKSSGKPYVRLEFDITEPEGHKAWSNRSLQPQSLWALKRTLITLGADEDVLDGELDLEEEVLPDLQGAECTLSIGMTEYEGEPSNQVLKVMSPGLAGADALPF